MEDVSTPKPSPNGVRMLTAEEIFAADDIEERVVEVPQWGGAVRVRGLTQEGSATLRKKAMRINPITKKDEMDTQVLEALLFIEGVIEPKFTMADYGKLQGKSMAAMSHVLKEIMDISGLSEAAVADATKSDADGFDVEV